VAVAVATAVVVLAGEAAADGSWYIPAAQGPNVFALLPPIGGTLTPTTATVDSIQIRRDQVDVCFRDAGTAQPCVTLVHPARAAAGEPRTRFFAVRAHPGATPPLLQAVAAWIARREKSTPWVAAQPAAVQSGPPQKSRRVRYLVIGLGALALVVVWFLTRRPRTPVPSRTPAQGAGAVPGNDDGPAPGDGR
jgi:hypothetical protein